MQSLEWGERCYKELLQGVPATMFSFNEVVVPGIGVVSVSIKVKVYYSQYTTTTRSN